MNTVYNKINQLVQNQSVIGMGSGSTIEGMIPGLADYIKDNALTVFFVPTSLKTERVLKQYGLNVTLDVTGIDFTIDGANQFTNQLAAVKGGGGSLLREKQIGYFSKHIFIIANMEKEVSTFNNVKIPIEINPFLSDLTKIEIERQNACLTDRMDGDTLFLTDNKNHIVDAVFNDISDLENLQADLLSIPGVIETGLFNRYIDRIYAYNDNTLTIYER